MPSLYRVLVCVAVLISCTLQQQILPPTTAPEPSPPPTTPPPTPRPTKAGGRPPTTPAPTTPAPTTAPPTTLPPSRYPTRPPSKQPSVSPTASPSGTPTAWPSDAPSRAPSHGPTKSPTSTPTGSPSNMPSVSPTKSPTTPEPTANPTTRRPTESGETWDPTKSPTQSPTKHPTLNPTSNPSVSPTTANPSMAPTRNPTASPSKFPTTFPSQTPSKQPTQAPSNPPTSTPTALPTKLPSWSPTMTPSMHPTSTPTINVVIDDQGEDVDGEQGDNDKQSAQATGGQSSDSALFTLPAIVFGSFCMLLTMLLMVVVIYQFSTHVSKKSKAKIKWIVKLPALCTFGSSLIGMSCLMIVCVLIQTSTTFDAKRYQMLLIPYTMLVPVYALSKLGVQLFFIARLRQTFDGSVFGVPTRTIVLLLLYMFCLNAAWMFQMLFQWNQHYAFAVVSVAEALFCVCLLYLFTIRLQRLLELQEVTCSRDASSRDTVSAVSSPSSLSAASSMDGTFTFAANLRKKSTLTIHEMNAVRKALSPKQTRLLFVITRCVILSAVAMMTTLAFGVFTSYYVNRHAGVALYVVYGLWFADMAINSVCVYMNFVFADKAYKRVCGCCHKGCQASLEWCTAKKLLSREHGRADIQLAKVMEKEAKEEQTRTGTDSHITN